MDSPEMDRVAMFDKAVRAPLNRYASGVSYTVDTTLDDINTSLDIIRGCECIRIAGYQNKATKTGVIIALTVDLKIQQLWFHRSPQILAVLVAVYGFVNFVSQIISFIRTVAQVVRIVTTVSDILSMLWPEYREFINRLWEKVSQLSSAVGWGADGFLHIMNAVQGGFNIWGAIQGKTINILETEIGQTAIDTATSLSFWCDAIKEDPGQVVKNIVTQHKMQQSIEMGKWWGNLMSGINEGLYRGETALRHVQTTYAELSALRVDMPAVIAKNIPQGIWDSLDQADSFIHDTIMPSLNRVQSLIETVEKATNTAHTRLSELARKLSAPGDLMEGVDDLLPAYKKLQEGKIDDVTSREFEYWTDTERIEIEHDLHEFDRIDALAKAPTEQPPYLELEIMPGKTVRGITAEPHETWFIDGYNDQH